MVFILFKFSVFSWIYGTNFFDTNNLKYYGLTLTSNKKKSELFKMSSKLRTIFLLAIKIKHYIPFLSRALPTHDFSWTRITGLREPHYPHYQSWTNSARINLTSLHLPTHCLGWWQSQWLSRRRHPATLRSRSWRGRPWRRRWRPRLKCSTLFGWLGFLCRIRHWLDSHINE